MLANVVARYKRRAAMLRFCGDIDGLAPGADPLRLAEINDEIAERVDKLYLTLQ